MTLATRLRATTKQGFTLMPLLALWRGPARQTAARPFGCTCLLPGVVLWGWLGCDLIGARQASRRTGMLECRRSAYDNNAT
jgi:hypothetical protein